MSEEGTYIRCECGNHIRVPADAAGMMVGPNSFCGQCGREGSFELVGRPSKHTLTPETLHEAVEKLLQQDIPQDFKALFPASCANDCLDAFGGRLEPCEREGLEAYDEIIEHNEGQGLIILVEKE